MCFSSYTKHLPTWESLKVHSFDCEFEHCTCHGDCIGRVESFRYLGVTIDSHLRWEEHLDKLSKNIRKLFCVFKTLRPILSLKLLKNVYYTLVQSLLSYGILAWGGTYSTILSKVNVIQRSVIKIALHKPRLFPTAQLFNLFKVFTVRELFVLEVFKYYFKERDHISHLSHSYTTRAINANHCCVIRARKTVQQRCYLYYTPKLCNLLPVDLRNHPLGMGSFVHKVKIWILKSGPEINSVFV